MAIRLKLALRNPKLRLAHKALLFAVTLWLLHSGEFGFWPVLLFFSTAIILYATPFFRTIELGSVFFVLLLVTLFSLKMLEEPAHYWLGSAYFAGLFYLVLGIKELAFIRRDELQRLLSLGLTYPIFLMFFYLNDAGLIYRAVFFGATVFILTRGVLKERLSSWLTTFLSLEIAWVALFLPIGFLGQAGIVSVFYFTLLDIAYHALERGLTKRKVMVHVSTLIILTLVVFLFSRWSV